MKILIDKVTSEPNHSLSKKDIDLVLKNIPNEWIGSANIFRLASQLFEKSKWPRSVIYNAPSYIIMSRGIDRKVVIKEFLIELAISSTIGDSLHAHTLNNNQVKKLEEVIEPFYLKIISE